MPYPIEKKLVVGVSTNALFNLQKAEKIFKEHGIEAYKEHQRKYEKTTLKPGPAFPFIRRFLEINKKLKTSPVEVVLLSKNSAETGLRTLHSIKEYGLDITRAAFTSGRSPLHYIPAYNISLFLSTNREDVDKAIDYNYPAGVILNSEVEDDFNDLEFRIAFDFDGVLADDESEKIYHATDSLDAFHEHESDKAEVPHNPGLLADFLKKISFFQKIEDKMSKKDKDYKKLLRTAVVTARNAPSHERAINTLKSWDINVDDMFFMGGIEKKRVLEVLKPHLFIDDQISHLNTEMKNIPLVHIPFGVRN